MKTGEIISKLIESLKVAKLVNRDKELEGDWKKEKKGVRRSLSVYLNYAFDHGVQGKPFRSDYWQPDAGWGWLVAVPEIIEFEGTIYIQCRYWNWSGGFMHRMEIRKAQIKASGKLEQGYVIYKQGVGYQSNSQYFVTLEGEVYEYSKEVISHGPVPYLPTGGINVGSTETIISENLVKLNEETDDLKEILGYLQDSKKIMAKEGLRSIMNGFFVLE